MSPQPFRKDSYRNPNGVRPPRTPGMGMGIGLGKGNPRDAWRREREAEQAERKAAEREQRLLADLRDTPEARAAWEKARPLLTSQVPGSTFALWLSPVECLGESKGALYLTAPKGIQAWCERRYGRMVGNAIREASDYRGGFLMPVPESMREEIDGCL